MNNQTPPANIEAEEAILGGILLDSKAISRVEAELKIEAFYVRAHQEIYRATLALHRQMKPTDFMAVTNYLSDRNLLEKVGGLSKLSQLLNQTISAVNIDRYVNLVMDKYIRRQLIASAYEIVNLGYDRICELEDILNNSQRKLFNVCEKKMNTGTNTTIDVSIRCLDQLENKNPIYK
ncbi:MAG: DnaB-like helicase N-terminal domain-containing protein [Pleurocapsa sp. MO_226.B13]|nr:DnaB-like helicase N-terminal domain-containing protein [Pleurocapsa sp. MO_226.B13]